MKKIIPFLTLSLLFVSFQAKAGDRSFVETSEDIVTKLTTTEKFAPTRSFVVQKPKTRAIILRFKENNTYYDKRVEITKDHNVVRLKVEFDTNSYSLRPASYAVLDQLAAALKNEKVKGRRVCIKGHTDNVGSAQYNLGLSHDRAHAVRDYVARKHDISPHNLYVFGIGEQDPIVENDSPAHKQMNRRVEITLECPELQL